MTSLHTLPEKQIVTENSSPTNESDVESSMLQSQPSSSPTKPMDAGYIDEATATDTAPTVTVGAVEAAADVEKKTTVVALEATTVEVLGLKTQASDKNTVVACDQVTEVSAT